MGTPRRAALSRASRRRAPSCHRGWPGVCTTVFRRLHSGCLHGCPAAARHREHAEIAFVFVRNRLISRRAGTQRRRSSAHSQPSQICDFCLTNIRNFNPYAVFMCGYCKPTATAGPGMQKLTGKLTILPRGEGEQSRRARQPSRRHANAANGSPLGC